MRKVEECMQQLHNYIYIYLHIEAWYIMTSNYITHAIGLIDHTRNLISTFCYRYTRWRREGKRETMQYILLS